MRLRGVILIVVLLAATCSTAVMYWGFGGVVSSHDDRRELSEQPPHAVVDQPSNFRQLTPEAVGPQASSSHPGDIPKAAPVSAPSYEGTLNDQVEKALSTNNANMAADLAAKLKDCEINSQVVAVEASRGATNSDPGAQAARLERLQEYQRQNAACQTVSGDQRQLRLRLLNLAAKEGRIGAAIEAFEAGSREPAVLSRVAADALLGDVKSLTTLAMYDPATLGVTKDDQDMARYVLKVAAADSSINKKIGNYLKIAESYAVPGSSFDITKMSDSSRIEGDKVLNRIRAQQANSKR